MFKDQSRYAKAKRHPTSNPRRNDEIKSIYIKLFAFISLGLVLWKQSGLAQAFGFGGSYALDFTADGYNDIERFPIMTAIAAFVFISALPLSYFVQAIRWRFVRLLAKVSKSRR